MSEPITVMLPQEIRQALDDLTRNEGIRRDDVVAQAISEHLFLRQFRMLRDRMTAKAQAQGILADQDVFDRVS